MRRRLNTEEIEEPAQDETSPSDSQTSSVEGIYGATSSSKISHPFKVVDHDAVSLQSAVSIGRPGRIISTSVGPNVSNLQQQALQASAAPAVVTPSVQNGKQKNSSSFVPEPDLVASCVTKEKSLGETVTDSPLKMPVAPPRRKRKNVSAPQRPDDIPISYSTENDPAASGATGTRRTTRAESSSSISSLQSPQPPSPTISIRSVSKDLDRTLDLSSQKFWIVRAQDEEKTRAKSSGPKVLRRTESLPKEMMDAFDPSGTGSLGGYSSHSNSNSSTLNSNQCTVVEAEGEHSAGPGNTTVTPSQLSSVVTAMAAAEEKKEADEHMNLILRTRTDSGKLLSDLEILEQVTVSYCLSFII